ncbi:unnamed protein product [Victoria cruziana]
MMGLMVPRESLLFIIPAFGGVVSWEGEASPFSEVDESIIHQVDPLGSYFSWKTSAMGKNVSSMKTFLEKR